MLVIGTTSAVLTAMQYQQGRPLLSVAITGRSLVTCQRASTLCGAEGRVSAPVRISRTPLPAVPLPLPSCSCTFGKASLPL